MRYLLLLIFLLTIIHINGQVSFTHGQTSRLDSLFTSEHDAGHFNGSVVIGNSRDIQYQYAIGTANRVWDIPLQQNHVFDMASINKSFVGVLIMMAREEGLLSTSDRLLKLLENYNYTGHFDSSITIHHLLTHTSGLPDYDQVDPILKEDDYRGLKRMHFTNEEYVDFISKLPARFTPGEDFLYSNFGYHLLCILLEDLYQMTFSEILEHKICNPLALQNTYNTTDNEEIHTRLVQGYTYDSNEDQWRTNPFIDLTIGRRIFTTTPDLYTWGRAIANEELLTTESWNQIKTNHLVGISKSISYGYGLVVHDGRATYAMGALPISDPYLIHGGATDGFKAMLVIVNDGDLILSILANTGNRLNEMKFTTKIIEILNHENQ